MYNNENERYIIVQSDDIRNLFFNCNCNTFYRFFLFSFFLGPVHISSQSTAVWIRRQKYGYTWEWHANQIEHIVTGFVAIKSEGSIQRIQGTAWLFQDKCCVSCL